MRICTFGSMTLSVFLIATTANAQIGNNGRFGSNQNIGASVGSTGTGVGVLERTSAFQQGSSSTSQNSALSGEVIQRDASAGFFSNLSNAAALNTFGATSFGGLGGFGTTGFGVSPFGNGGGFGRTGFGTGQNPNQQLNTGSANSARTQLRTRIRVDFEAPQRDVQVVSEQMTQRLMNIPQIEKLGPVQVTLAGRTATLTGTVATDHARDLAERLVMLEPGVSAVQNELSVATADTTDTARPEATLLPLPQ